MIPVYQMPFDLKQLCTYLEKTTLSRTLPNEYAYQEQGTHFSLREVSYPDDMVLLYHWMNMPHIIPQWQLNKSLKDLSVYFEKMLADDHHRLYLVGIDGAWVGYTEIYEGARDRLAGYYEADKDDLGWHLLLAESKAYGQGYLRSIVRMLTFFIFEHSHAKKVVGEPDATVKPYEAVAQELLYEPQYLIEMPEKKAMLYFCFRHPFLDKFASYQNANV
ncbi:N(6)-hydroxylysine O-acetyltransferase [Enhydrobacter sp. 8BJ]|jgi:acetyl CoA:N6-hydroxylysine acetyl transferase|uniref:N(6)-hydroxylysine O-acetyltransferase n=3 Tax=Faucicola osloensis TaxID=34062 RepID=A0A378QZP5_FAUOS|nr:GNAT family N-acetyltransferase [Enhydrobacter sp. 8BJ]STZ04933.1 N(6)-hydroxylysine O-acetyltransferase [Moraxella osloensis]VXB23585.1 N(6)-hydroxylysine O-acetyltransferase [Enhydrobacter sp. 8BJ]